MNHLAKVIKLIGRSDSEQRDAIRDMLYDFLFQQSSEGLLEEYVGPDVIGDILESQDEDEDDSGYTEEELQGMDSDQLLDAYYGRGDLINDWSKDISKETNPIDEALKLMNRFDKSITKEQMMEMIESQPTEEKSPERDFRIVIIRFKTPGSKNNSEYVDRIAKSIQKITDPIVIPYNVDTSFSTNGYYSMWGAGEANMMYSYKEGCHKTFPKTAEIVAKKIEAKILKLLKITSPITIEFDTENDKRIKKTFK